MCVCGGGGGVSVRVCDGDSICTLFSQASSQAKQPAISAQDCTNCLFFQYTRSARIKMHVCVRNIM